MLKVDGTIVNWLDKVNGRTGVEDIVIIASPKGLHISQYDQHKYQYIDTFLAKEHTAFEKYDISEKQEIIMPLPDIKTLIGTLQLFGGKIVITPDKTDVIFTNEDGTKEIHYQYIDVKMVPHYDEAAPKVKYPNTITVPLSFMKSVQSAIRLFGGDRIKFTHVKKELAVRVVGSNHRFVEKLKTDKDFKSEILLPLNLTEQLTRTFSRDTITIGFPDDIFSLKFEERGDHFYSINIISSVEEEEPATKPEKEKDKE